MTQPADYEVCARCGCDHEYDHELSQSLHSNCILCKQELESGCPGDGPDHNCVDCQVGSTSGLWQSTHLALCGQHWSLARKLLDELGRKDDNVDMLRSAWSYGVPEMFSAIIQDRIDLVNAKARNHSN